MKFRFATPLLEAILVAIAFVSAAQATDPELRVSYYERWVESTEFHVCQQYPNTNVALMENYLYDNLWYDPWDNGIWLTPRRIMVPNELALLRQYQ